MKKPVELSANRRLLEPQFEGYRLGGRAPGGSRLPLSRPPQELRPLVQQRSLLHTRRLALHNALHPPHNQHQQLEHPHTHYVDGDGAIWLAYHDAKLYLQCLLQPHPQYKPAQHHPAILQILPQDRAIFNVQPQRLLILETSPLITDPWKIVADLEPLGSEACFSLLDARYRDETTLHCLLQCIEQEDNKCVNIVEWIVLTYSDGNWKCDPYRKLRGNGAIYYAALETDCKAAYVAADHPVDFVKADRDSSEIPEVVEERPKRYKWKQTSRDIALTVLLNSVTPGVVPNIESSRDALAVAYDGVDYLRGKLHADIESELTTWSIENGVLNILLLKCNPGAVWITLLKDGDPDGERLLDQDFVDEVHARLSHLCSETEVAPENAPLFNSQQLEECDFVAEEESCLVRLDASLSQITHQAFLSSHQMILNVSLNSSEVSALGLRHDADTCLWQPYPASDGEWQIKHEGTLLAFGYVQSSKQQKKYTVCSPNLEYSVVCEANRHAFIYRQQWTPQEQSQLRYRNSSGENRHVKVGRQQLISFDRDDEVLGICATNEILFVLTEKNIIAYNMTE